MTKKVRLIERKKPLYVVKGYHLEVYGTSSELAEIFHVGKTKITENARTGKVICFGRREATVFKLK